MSELEAEIATCHVCKWPLPSADPLEPPICDGCRVGLGPHLSKSLYDEFHYAVGLRNGMVFEFECSNLTVKGQWLLLPKPDKTFNVPGGMPLERGLQVRLTEVAWVADAPRGS